MTVRRFIHHVHLWVGLATALPVVFMSITGTLLVFETELQRLENWRTDYVTPGTTRVSYDTVLAAMRTAHPELEITHLSIPESPRHAVVAWARERTPEPPYWLVSANPYTGAVTGARPQDAGLMPLVRRLHTNFGAGPIGETIATVCTGIFVVVLISGLCLWLKRGGGWRKYVIARNTRPRRRLYDLHAVAGLYSFVLLLIIAVSGTLIGIGVPWREFILEVTGSTWRKAPSLEQPVPLDRADRISLDRAVAIADTAFPGTRGDFITVPREPSDPIRIGRLFSWTTTPYPSVSVHPLTGEVTDIDDPRRYDLGHLIHRVNRGIHSGEFFGLAGDLMWFAASLAPVLLAYTGFRLWWRPRPRAQAQTAPPSAVRSEAPSPRST